jgi:hypothetical protein
VLNNTVLSNEIYVKRVKEIIADSVNCEMYDNEPLIWWDNLKYQIKRYSKLFSSNLAKEKRKDFFYIQNKIQRLCDASHIYNQKSGNIDFKGLAEVINKLIFNSLHNPPPTKDFDIIINPLYSKLNLVLVEDCGCI